MSLINVKEIGYGLKGDTLDITIAIPKDSYLESFVVYNQIDARDADYTSGNIGRDYIKIVKNAYGYSNEKQAFLEIFKYVGSSTEVTTGNVYDIYQIKPDFLWAISPDVKGEGIKVSKKDLTIITMKVYSVVTSSFIYPTGCGEDNPYLTIPLFDLLPLRLRVLDEAKSLRNNCNPCDVSLSFMDKLLQLKVIEMAICCLDYCKALSYWDKFFGTDTVEVKKCGCHG